MNKILEKLLILSKIFKQKKVSISNDDSLISITTNKHGGVSKFETQQILSDHKGQYRTQWYFRLEPECGVSADGKSLVFAIQTLEHDNPINEEMYIKYSKTMQKNMAEYARVDEKYIIQLTKEEYNKQLKEG